MTLLITIIILSCVVIIHELGHFFAAKWCGIKVDEFGIGFPPKLVSKKWGETVYSINLLPFGGFVKLHGENEEVDHESERSFIKKAPWKKALVLVSGVLMNIVLGWFLFIIISAVGVPQSVFVSEVREGSPASLAGIEKGDAVLSISYGEITIVPKTAEDVVLAIEAAKEERILLTLERNGKEITEELEGRLRPPEGEGPLGIGLVEVGIEKKSIGASIIEGAKETGMVLKSIVIGFGTLIAGIWGDHEVFKNVTGPVGIFNIAMSLSTLGVLYLLHFVAFISLNLAVLNIIPFPALDGGRLLFVGIEKLIRKRVPQKWEMYLNLAGFSVLILLTIVITIRDVRQLL